MLIWIYHIYDSFKSFVLSWIVSKFPWCYLINLPQTSSEDGQILRNIFSYGKRTIHFFSASVIFTLGFENMTIYFGDFINCKISFKVRKIWEEFSIAYIKPSCVVSSRSLQKLNLFKILQEKASAEGPNLCWGPRGYAIYVLQSICLLLQTQNWSFRKFAIQSRSPIRKRQGAFLVKSDRKTEKMLAYLFFKT